MSGRTWSAAEKASRLEARAEARSAQVIPTHPRGCKVRAHVRSAKYNRRVGVVITYNLGEIGVSFGDGKNVTAWFLPAELERV